MSSALSIVRNLSMIKKNNWIVLKLFFYLYIAKKVYMVSDESKLHITLYNRLRHMHDMPQKLTLIESYFVRPTTRVPMTSLQGWFHVVGSHLKHPSNITVSIACEPCPCHIHDNPANYMSWCVIRT